MVICVIISILDWLEDGEYVELYELLGWCVIPPLLSCLIQYTKGSKFVYDSNRKIMNNKQLDELDAWKDLVLKVILEKGGATLTDYIWGD